MIGLFCLVSHLANRGINITEIAARNSHRIRSKPCAARGTRLDLGPVHASQEHQAVHGIFSKKNRLQVYGLLCTDYDAPPGLFYFTNLLHKGD